MLILHQLIAFEPSNIQIYDSILQILDCIEIQSNIYIVYAFEYLQQVILLLVP